MTEPTTSLVTRACPNCGTHNYPNASVCESCGIHLDAFENAQPELHKQKQDAVSEQRRQLQASTSAEVRQETRAGIRRLSLQIILAFGVALLALGAIAGFAAWNNYQQQLRRERLSALYEHATSCFAQKDYVCARDEFGALLNEEPNYRDVSAKLLDAQLGYAKQQIELGQPQKALQELEPILLKKPDNKQVVDLVREAHYRQADLYIRENKWEQAIAELQKILFVTPNERDVLKLLNQARYGLAVQYANQGRQDQSIAELLKILQIQPNDEKALSLLRQTQVNLATQYLQQRKFQNAVNVLENSATYFPNDPRMLALLKNVYDAWYNDAVNRSDWFTALSVSTQRSLRFPTK